MWPEWNLWKFSLNCHKAADKCFSRSTMFDIKLCLKRFDEGFSIFRTSILQLGAPGFFFKKMVLSGTGFLPSELLVLLKGDVKRWWEWWLTLGGSCPVQAVLCSRCSSMCHDLQWRVRWRSWWPICNRSPFCLWFSRVVCLRFLRLNRNRKSEIYHRSQICLNLR